MSTALITGAAGGIGAAIARKLASDGYAVAVTDLDQPGAHSIVEQIQANNGTARAYRLDVSNRGEVEAAVAEVSRDLGLIDVLVNNAGFANQTAFLQQDPDEWHSEFAVIVDGLIHCSRAVQAGMAQRGHGCIVNIGSVNGLAFYSHPTYSAAKAALFSLTQSMAGLFGRQGIRVNAIAPGTIRTPIWDEKVSADPTIFGGLEPYLPLGHVGLPEHIADAVAFLVSDAASHITGTILPVDGGLGIGILPMATLINGPQPDADDVRR
jgi:meso-butanediol dehydrogenase/(S,S)-butanediol dehydrogenase/diacetyl reductase